ncbi:hypothetical protein [Rossellomorea aquimaris]|uniref:hypothetical protein n=1 Tax=Rossellomorea aquimaris TaxID=189382 RepID=UPI0007D07B60|nr:hypothetical protein [Rossellomorea aquimaris]
MYKNSKGFSLPETLLAFSCFTVMAGVFLPFLIRYSIQLQVLLYEVSALQYLEEGLEKALVTHEFTSQIRYFKGVRYELEWKEGNEVCVQYEREPQGAKEICVSKRKP